MLERLLAWLGAGPGSAAGGEPWLPAWEAVVLLAGASGASMAYLALHGWHTRRRGHYPAAAPGWRGALLWPLDAASHGMRRLCSPRHRRRLERGAARAGLAAGPVAARVFGAQCLGAMAGGLAGVALSMSSAWGPWLVPAVMAGAGAAWPLVWLRDRARQYRRALARDLPFVLDMMTLCMEAGLNLPGALRQAATKGPPGALADELGRVLGEIRAGAGRLAALQAMAARVDEPGISRLVGLLAQAEATGANLARSLRALADQQRADRFLAAEKQALEAPVKMLLPLVLCIFPCTFIVIAFPVAVRLLEIA